jgi:hypothetical protein
MALPLQLPTVDLIPSSPAFNIENAAAGCIQYRECTQVHFSADVCVYIYIYGD